ncbi:MAG: hypothetical protein ABIJ56_01635, partial [Pseudomonadota bacterium]
MRFATWSVVAVLAFACNGQAVRMQTLPVMKEPVVVVKATDMPEDRQFSLFFEDRHVGVITEDDGGLKLTRIREDGDERETKMLVAGEESWWDVSEELVGETCGELEVIRESGRLLFDRKGVFKHGNGFLLAFGAESVISCKGGGKATHALVNYFLASFDNQWTLKAGPWKGWSGPGALRFMPVHGNEGPALFWIGQEEIAVIMAPAGLEGEGKLRKVASKMKVGPDWGRSAVLEAAKLDNDVMLAAAYVEEDLGEEVTNSIVVSTMNLSDFENASVVRLKTRHLPTSVSLSSVEQGIMVAWAVTGEQPPSGSIASIITAKISSDGTVDQPQTVYEKKDLTGEALFIKTLACSSSAGTFAAAWVHDRQGLEGMEESLAFYTAKHAEMDSGRLFNYALHP